MCKLLPDLCQGLFIGRVLRSRHPPEYFNGLMAQSKTEPEVYAIFEEALDGFLASDKQILMADGIPRLPSQVGWLTETLATRPLEAIRPCLVRLEVSEAVQAERSRLRGGNASERALTESRLTHDRPMLEDVYREVDNLFGKDAWRVFSIDADCDQDELLDKFCFEVSKLIKPSREELVRLVAV